MLKTLSSSSLPRAVARRGSAAVVNALSSNEITARSFHNSSKSLNSEPSSSSSASTQQQQQTMIAHHLHHNNPHLLGSLSVRHPASPFVLGWGDVECEMEEPRFAGACMRTSLDDGLPLGVVDDKDLLEEEDEESLDCRGRNTRPLTKSNHGKRPNNRLGRRARRRRYGNPKRQ